MGVEPWVWGVSLVGLVGILIVDLLIIGRKPHRPRMRESALWVLTYVAAAVVFGIGIWRFEGADFAGQFFAGWLTEYSLSLDNLFVFIIIMSRFAVPPQFQQKVLMIGIVLALILRGAFIAVGAALISRFDWVFFIFGAFLLYTAARVYGHAGSDDSEFKENVVLRTARRVLRTAPTYDEQAHFFTHMPDSKRRLSPLIVVVIAIGTTDLLFALDSIPAIFGLTTDAYIVFATNVFALMGLRQLYFLLGGLLERLKYLSYGLSIILAFIGLKLIAEALAGNNLSFLNGGRPISWAPHIPIWLSLTVIGATLTVTTVASLISTRNDNRAATVNAKTQDNAKRDTAKRDTAKRDTAKRDTAKRDTAKRDSAEAS